MPRDDSDRSIRIEAELYELLRQRGKMGDSFNDVIRDLLGLPRKTREPRVAAIGALLPLVHAGELGAGQTLHWYQPRKKLTHQAIVEPDGYLRTNDGLTWPTPCMASRAVGGSTHGWKVWQTESSETLAELMDCIAGR